MNAQRKARTAETGAGSQNIFNTRNSTTSDPLLGWFSLARQSALKKAGSADGTKKGGQP
jgi:hypothetical protein